MTVRFERSILRSLKEREELLLILEEAFAAIDSEALVRFAVRTGEDAVELSHAPRVWILALGKAALPMARAASAELKSVSHGGLIVAPHAHGGRVQGLRTIEAGHPMPDESSLRAAQAVSELAEAVAEEDVVLCLLSGGGSALLAAPARGLGLRDLVETTDLLLRSSVPIDDVNVVRRHLSMLQGGGLARLLGRASRVVTLVLSDVVRGSLESIASGPTVPDPTTFADAIRVLRTRGLWDRTPRTVRRHLKRGLRGAIPETAKPGEPAFKRFGVRVLADHRTLSQAVSDAASTRGFEVVSLSCPFEGEAREVGRELALRAVDILRSAPRRTLLVGGGETTVTVRGSGCGGRNQEAAVSAAGALAGENGVTLLFVASDGTDGPTDAAGGIVDGDTIRRAALDGIDPHRVLADNDAYRLLASVGDLLRTGPTRTNVADLFVVQIDGPRG